MSPDNAFSNEDKALIKNLY